MTTKASDILQRGLDIWAEFSYTFEGYANLHNTLVDNEAGPDVMNHLLGSLERYIQERRIETLDQMWGGVAKGTPEQAKEVTVPTPELIRLNGIVGFYGVNRVFVFLYVHAYLMSKIGAQHMLNDMRELVDELDPK